VVVVPVVVLAVLLVVQYALAYYARQVLAGAAPDAAAAAARPSASGAEGTALARQLIGEGGGTLLDSYAVSATSDGDTVTVTATGRVASLLPFFGTITVKASGSAHVERFQPQGGGP
jgi:Flp pilus assembly protein TadG